MTVEEMEELLERLNIEVLNVNGSEIQGHCPAHVERTGKEDRNPSWWINADTGAHICFSCNFKGGLQGLVSYVNGFGFEEAKEWVQTGGPLSEMLAKALRPKAEAVLDPITISEAYLAPFTDPPEEALRSRGLNLVSAQHYGVLWNPRQLNWILPIRAAETGELLGWQEKGYKDRYFNNYPKGMKKSVSIFGYSQYTGGNMIVVESPLDAVRLRSVGVFGGVSTYGCSVSKSQIDLIRGADRVIFAMDNDKAGSESSKELLKACYGLGFEAWFFDYSGTDQKDVGGMSQFEIHQGLCNAKHSVRGKKAFV